MRPNKLKEHTMSANADVRARIDEHIKEEATARLAMMGLTLSDAIRIMLKCVAHAKAPPFEPLVPNATTMAAMKKKARRGGLLSFATVEALMADLNEQFIKGSVLSAKNYSDRKGLDLAEMERWLAPNLAYEPASR